MQITSMMPTCLTMQTPIISTRGSTVVQGDTGGSGRNICKNFNLKCFQLKIETKTLKSNCYERYLDDCHYEVDQVGHPSELFKGVENPECQQSIL